jgi:hypothetical protein
VSNFFTIVTTDLVFFTVALSAFVPDVVASIAPLLLFLAVTSQMADAVAFVALLA